MLLAGIDHSHLRQGAVLFYSVFLMKKLSEEEKKNVEGFFLIRNQSKQAHIALVFRAVGTTPALVSSHSHSQVRAIDSFMPALCFFCKWGPLRALLKKAACSRQSTQLIQRTKVIRFFSYINDENI